MSGAIKLKINCCDTQGQRVQEAALYWMYDYDKSI